MEKDLVKLRQRCFGAALRKGFSKDFAEEFAQEMVAGGLGAHQTVDQGLIDFMRKHIHDPRSPTNSVKDGLLKSISIEEIQVPALNPGFEQMIVVSDLAELFDNKIDRACFYLYAVWGFEMREIALCFNLTPSAISFRIRKIRMTVRQYYKEKHNYDPKE